MSVPAQAVKFGMPGLGGAVFGAMKGLMTIPEFLTWDAAAQGLFEGERGGYTPGKYKPYLKRPHGIIGGIPLFNVTRYQATNAERPLFFRPSGEVFMSAREGGALNTVRIEMFVTGPFALAYIRSLEMLQRLGNGRFISQLRLTGAGLPTQLVSQPEMNTPVAAGPTDRWREFTYPFITKTDLFFNAKITYLHKEREVEHGINFGYVIKLDIVKITDPYIIGKSASLVNGARGVSLDDLAHNLWTAINTVGILLGADGGVRRFRAFGPLESRILEVTHADWKKVAQYPYNRVYENESVETEIKSPALPAIPVNFNTSAKVDYTDPSNRFGTLPFVLALDYSDGVPLSSMPVRSTISSGNNTYTMNLNVSPFKSADSDLMSTRMGLYTTSSDPNGREQSIGNLIIQDGTFYKMNDYANGKEVYIYITDYSWPIDENTIDISTVPVRMRMWCSIK